LGLVIVAAYVPLYWWRKITDKRLGITDEDEMPVVVGSPGGIDLDASAPQLETLGETGAGALPTISAMRSDTEL
jgi:hypothetical protein